MGDGQGNVNHYKRSRTSERSAIRDKLLGRGQSENARNVTTKWALFMGQVLNLRINISLARDDEDAKLDTVAVEIFNRQNTNG